MARLQAREAVGAEPSVGGRKGDPAWIQELGHDGRRIWGKGPAWTRRSKNRKGATDPLGFLGGEVITCEDHGETIFSLSRWRSRSQTDPTMWQSAPCFLAQGNFGVSLNVHLAFEPGPQRWSAARP